MSNKLYSMYKILIVEDEPALQSVMKDKLKKEKFEVVQAHNGFLGLEMTKQEKPDLILLDIIMPRMDGLTMLDKLKKDRDLNRIPVIILSNLSDSEAVVRARQNNVFDYLVKTDWSLEDVVKKIREKLS